MSRLSVFFWTRYLASRFCGELGWQEGKKIAASPHASSAELLTLLLENSRVYGPVIRNNPSEAAQTAIASWVMNNRLPDYTLDVIAKTPTFACRTAQEFLVSQAQPPSMEILEHVILLTSLLRDQEDHMSDLKWNITQLEVALAYDTDQSIQHRTNKLEEISQLYYSLHIISDEHSKTRNELSAVQKPMQLIDARAAVARQSLTQSASTPKPFYPDVDHSQPSRPASRPVDQPHKVLIGAGAR